jgi:hypothetical protein
MMEAGLTSETVLSNSNEIMKMLNICASLAFVTVASFKDLPAYALGTHTEWCYKPLLFYVVTWHRY